MTIIIIVLAMIVTGGYLALCVASKEGEDDKLQEDRKDKFV